MTQIYTEREKLFSMAIVAHRQDLIDRAVLETLIDKTSPQVVFDIMLAFIKTLDEAIQSLEPRDSLSNEQLYRICHKVKGSSLLVGFVKLGEECKKVTVMASSTEPLSGVREIIEHLILSLKQVKTCVEIIQQ